MYYQSFTLKINNVYLRQEKNGVTIYDLERDIYLFFENITIDYFKDISTSENVYKVLKANNYKCSYYIDYQYPLKINWMITNKCNLDCIYCLASDKMINKENNINHLEIAKHILSFKPITINISGGEPTIDSNLIMILDYLTDKTSVVLDSNGSIPIDNNLLNAIKKANASVRISIDSIDEKINKVVRPSKNNNNYLDVVINNIKLLLKENIKVSIHTVLTNINYSNISDLGKIINELGIKYWHLYGLINMGRAKESYSSLCLEYDKHLQIKKQLEKQFKDMKISLSLPNKKSKQTRALMVDADGRFYVECAGEKPIYISKDNKKVGLDEINKILNIDSYIKSYLSDIY